MSDIAHQAELRVDAFVAAVNATKRVPLFRVRIPEQCQLSEIEWSTAFDWRIVRSENADWLAGVEGRLPFRLPPTFRSLVSRYLFPSFAAGPLTFYSVGVPDQDPGTMEYQFAIFADVHLSPFLLENGFLPFARPSDGHYDQVCFDCRGSKRKLEPPVVRIDHEEVLCNRRIRVMESLSPGFDALIEETTRQLQRNAKG